jgi:hypothetical protein
MSILAESIEDARLSSAQAFHTGEGSPFPLPSVLVPQLETISDLLKKKFVLMPYLSTFILSLSPGQYMTEIKMFHAPKHLKYICAIEESTKCKISTDYRIIVTMCANMDIVREELSEFFNDIGF